MGVGTAPNMLLPLLSLVMGHSSERVDLWWHDVLHLSLKNSFENSGLTLQVRKVVCLSEENWIAVVQENYEVVCPTL